METLSQPSVVALFKSALMIPVLKSYDMANVVLRIMEIVKDLGLNTTHETLWKCIIGHCDLALQRSHSAFLNQHETSSAWWWKVQHFASLILPDAATCICMREKTDFHRIKEHVLEVYGSSGIGRKLVGKVAKAMQMEKVTEVVKIAVDKLEGKNITKASLTANRRVHSSLQGARHRCDGPLSKEKGSVCTLPRSVVFKIVFDFENKPKIEHIKNN